MSLSSSSATLSTSITEKNSKGEFKKPTVTADDYIALWSNIHEIKDAPVLSMVKQDFLHFLKAPPMKKTNKHRLVHQLEILLPQLELVTKFDSDKFKEIKKDINNNGEDLEEYKKEFTNSYGITFDEYIATFQPASYFPEESKKLKKIEAKDFFDQYISVIEKKDVHTDSATFPQSFHDVINAQGMVFYKEKKYDLALKCFKECVSIGPSIPLPLLNTYKTSLANTWQSLGTQYYEAKEYKKALDCFKESVSIGTSISLSFSYMDNYKTWLANTWHCLGNQHNEAKEYEKALECYKESVSIGTSISLSPSYMDNYKTCLANTWNSLGEQYYEAKEYEKALECHRECVSIGASVSLPSSFMIIWNTHLFYALHALGDQHSKVNEYKQAVKFYKECMSIKEFNSSSDIDMYDLKIKLATALNEVGNQYYKETQYEKAVEAYKDCVLIATSCSSFRPGLTHSKLNIWETNLAIALHEIGNQYGRKNQYEKAIEVYRDCRLTIKFIFPFPLEFKLWRPKFINDFVSTLCRLGVKNFEEKKYEQALSYFREAQTLSPIPEYTEMQKICEKMFPLIQSIHQNQERTVLRSGSSSSSEFFSPSNLSSSSSSTSSTPQKGSP